MGELPQWKLLSNQYYYPTILTPQKEMAVKRCIELVIIHQLLSKQYDYPTISTSVFLLYFHISATSLADPFFEIQCRRLKAALLSIGHTFTFSEVLSDFGSSCLLCSRLVWYLWTIFCLYLIIFLIIIIILTYPQALTIIAFRKEHLDIDTFKILLSAGPTYAIMNFIECKFLWLTMFTIRKLKVKL